MNLQTFYKDTIKNGGASFNLLTGEYNPSDGFMLAIKGHEFQIPIENFNHKVLSDYIKKNADLLISGVTDNKFLGSWIDKGIVYLDCSVKFDRVVPALESGIDQGELAIWSNENKTSISCTQYNLEFHKNILDL